MKKNILIIFSVLLCGACSSEFKKTIGLNKSSPNEYAVLRQPMLSMPPSDYLIDPEQYVKPLASSDKTGSEILFGLERKESLSEQFLDYSDRNRNFIKKTTHIEKNEDIQKTAIHGAIKSKIGADRNSQPNLVIDNKNLERTVGQKTKTTDKPKKGSLLSAIKSKIGADRNSQPNLVIDNKTVEKK